jgi:hypothetical protein
VERGGVGVGTGERDCMATLQVCKIIQSLCRLRCVLSQLSFTRNFRYANLYYVASIPKVEQQKKRSKRGREGGLIVLFYFL